MKTLFHLNLSIAALFLCLSCGPRTETAPQSTTIAAQTEAEGDSTIYGLACDGCTDTILVLLRDIKGNPDTFNILNATRRHHIFGDLSIGDKIAVVRNSRDTTVADIVIDLESMRGKWCYQVMPTLRQRADTPEQTQAQMLAQMPDSLRDSLMVPREYGFQVLGERNIKAVGIRPGAWSSDEESPVEYPVLKNYRDWHLFNGRLVLSETTTDSVGQQHVSHNDTADFIMLRPDTLVLQFGKERRGYYRKQD